MKNSTQPFGSSFWFRPVSAAGFGLMRIGFGTVGFLTFLFEMGNIQRYFGPQGILPHAMINAVMRDAWRFSLLDYASTTAVWWLYGFLLLSLFLTAIGLYTRFSLLSAVILLFSFHEYGTITLDGGDTLLRLIGFILVLSPCHRALSVDNLLKRFKLAHATGKEQEPSERTMPIWPYRLLLWQMIILYIASVIEKLQGETWKDGTAVSIVLHHENFSRLPLALADHINFLSPIISYFTLASQMAWGVLLPLGALSAFRLGIGSRGFDAWKRALLLSGVIIHGSILLFMDVGTFSLTIFVAYCGLLLDNDFRSIRSVLNAQISMPLIVLFDGRCGFCSNTVTILRSFDWLHRLVFVNFHDPDIRKKYAQNLSKEALDAAMHVRRPNGTYEAGFFGFRLISKHLPPLWIFVPFFYLPFVPAIGTQVYTWVSHHRR